MTAERRRSFETIVFATTRIAGSGLDENNVPQGSRASAHPATGDTKGRVAASRPELVVSTLVRGGSAEHRGPVTGACRRDGPTSARVACKASVITRFDFDVAL